VADAKERRRLLTFVVIGGGPTGVKMAGAFAEKARRSLERLGVEVWVGSPVGQCDAEGIAPAAKQERAYVARLLIRRLTGK